MATQDPKKSAPTLDRVDNASGEEVKDNGETTSTTLTLRGTIDPDSHSRAQILDNDALIGFTIAAGDNFWSLLRSDWSFGLHTVTLKTADGGELARRTFTVKS